MPPFLKKYRFQDPEPGAAGGGTTPTAGTPDPDVGKTFSHDYVKELREENKSWRLKAQNAEADRDTHKTAAEKATETAKEVTTAAQAAADQRVIRAELKTVALKAGMVDLDGLKLADLSTVKLDDKGEVEGADALIEALKKAKPYLFGTPGNSSTPVVPPSNKPPEAKKAADMTDAEYAAARSKFK